MSDEMVGLNELAEWLGCHKRTVMTAVERGQLPRPVMVASLPRWFKADVERALRRQQEGNTENRSAEPTPRAITA